MYVLNTFIQYNKPFSIWNAPIMNKVILIGIDGATPQLLHTWVDQGYLPTFKKIHEHGCRGELTSTIPPFSAPAWTSIVTGCNPGKHGIYGFESTGTLSPHLITSRSRKVPAIWNYFTDIGIPQIIIPPSRSVIS